MSKQRRTADDFVRDMKAKQQQQHSTPDDSERKTSEAGQSSNKTPARPQRPATRLRLFRGRARTAISVQAADER